MHNKLSMANRILVLFLLMFTSCHDGESQIKKTVYTGYAVKIIDGDTFDLLTDDHKNIRIRMFGIDCPERGQDFYKVCKTALGNILLNQKLKVNVQSIDQYKRVVGDVYSIDGKQWMNYNMVAGGYAWHYTHYDHNPKLDKAEQAARNTAAGLWKDANPVAPWDWRKEKRNKAAF